MSDDSPNPKITPETSSASSSGSFSSRGAFPLEYASSFRRWTARTFTWENVTSGLKTFMWVAPLTILIWVYAEREQVVRKEVTIPIAVKSTDPNRIVTLRPGDESIVATIEGPRLAVDRLSDLVTAPGQGPVVVIEFDGRGYESGKWGSFDTEKYVGDNAIFRNRGVTLRECQPRTLQILVDELVEKEVEVRAPSDLTNFAAPPAFEPRTVRVRGPRAKLEDTREPLVAVAELSGREEIQTPGPKDIAAVPVRVSIQDPAITIVPTTVRAIIDVSQREEKYQIASMPIWHNHPPGLLPQYRIESPTGIPNITVIGPHDQIQLIASGQFRPMARLDVTADDAGKRQQRELKFELPDRVKVVAEDREKTRVSFQLIKESAPE